MLAVKIHMFLKILTFSLLSLGLIILSRGVSKEGFKIGVQDVARRFQSTLPSHFRLGSTSVTDLERFWTPKGRPKEIHCAFPGIANASLGPSKCILSILGSHEASRIDVGAICTPRELIFVVERNICPEWCRTAAAKKERVSHPPGRAFSS